jgi:hypothetical protein
LDWNDMRFSKEFVLETRLLNKRLSEKSVSFLAQN